ncbi:MAG: hypothetical protein JWR69_3337 [Pedosphaera sp.]|nr:hypothetical protein [Pedosphaera sp.]
MGQTSHGERHRFGQSSSGFANQMRVLLQDTETGLYFRNHDTWTESIRQARDFEFYERAIGFACEAGIWDARIIRILQWSGHVETFVSAARYRPVG